MPHATSSPTESLSELAEYLRRGPVGECSELRDVVFRLSNPTNDDELETTENIVQLLGTTVGQHSQVPSQFYPPSKLIVRRGMATTISK